MWDLKQYGDKQALISDKGQTLSYYELEIEGKKLIQQMNGRCLVFSMCTNTLGSILGYVAFLNNNIVPILLNANMDSELLNKLLEIYHPAYIWAPSENSETFENFEKVYETEGYVLLKTDFEKIFLLHEALALLLTTSGSTGSPKFVRQSYENIQVNAEQIAEYLQLDASERPITTLPMNYTYGLSIINSHLLVGATILVTEKGLMQREFWDFFRSAEATSFGGVPYTYEMLERLRFRNMELPSLRYMTQAGGKLSPELHERFARYAEENGKKFIVMYGQCEATARMGYLPADMAIDKCGSMGIAIPRGKFYLIDSRGARILEPHVTGELIYEGANVTLGYAECGDDLAKGDERGGGLETGDMAQFDEDGYYYIVGRKKRFLKIYGNRVNLDEIDRMIKAEYEDCDLASTGVDDHMYIFITDEKWADGIKKFVVSKTKLNPAAFKVVVIDKIPRNDAGKILYKQLSEYYGESSGGIRG